LPICVNIVTQQTALLDGAPAQCELAMRRPAETNVAVVQQLSACFEGMLGAE
jgi:hypothetical protein